MGEKEPFGDWSISHAKCADCLKKQVEETRKESAQKPKDWPYEETPAQVAANAHQVSWALAQGILEVFRKEAVEEEKNKRQKRADKLSSDRAKPERSVKRGKKKSARS